MPQAGATENCTAGGYRTSGGGFGCRSLQVWSELLRVVRGRDEKQGVPFDFAQGKLSTALGQCLTSLSMTVSESGHRL